MVSSLTVAFRDSKFFTHFTQCKILRQLVGLSCKVDVVLDPLYCEKEGEMALAQPC